MAEARRDFTTRSDRIETLVERIENTPDPAFRAVAQELLQAVIELHGIALERMLDAVAQLPSGHQALVSIAGDELVSCVLSLHGIHPVALETRISSALEQAQPYLNAHGGSVELASIDADGTVHVRLQGTCGSCGSSTETLKNKVEAAIYDAAPEVVTVIAEPVPRPASSDLVMLQTR